MLTIVLSKSRQTTTLIRSLLYQSIESESIGNNINNYKEINTYKRE